LKQVVLPGVAENAVAGKVELRTWVRSGSNKLWQRVSFPAIAARSSWLEELYPILWVFSRIAAIPFQNPTDVFRHTELSLRLSLSSRERKLRIVNCGDFCGDLSYILGHLATPQINLPHLLNCLNLRGLQGFLPSVQHVSFFVLNGLRNQRSGVRIAPGAPFYSASFQKAHTPGSSMEVNSPS
jgi:hypothetical protein